MIGRLFLNHLAFICVTCKHMQWGRSCVETSSLVFSKGGWMRRWLVRLFPAVDLGLGGPKAACQALPALPRGLPALAQGQQAATTAAPHRPIQKVSAWVHSSSLASQLSRGWLWLSFVCTCDQCEDEPALTKARLAGHRRCRQRCQDAKNLPTTHPHLCLPIHNEGLIHRSLSRQLSKHYSNPSFPLMQSRSSLKNAKVNLKRNGIIRNM